jgi:DNA-binding transcriptional MerR regulator
VPLDRVKQHMSQPQVRETVYLRTAQVAEILGITKRTLKNWLKAKWIPEPERNPANRYRRWTLQDVETVRRILNERNQAR